jgi:phospholipase C
LYSFITEQSVTYNTTNQTRVAEVINVYNPIQTRVFATMAENFVLFDRWFCSVPGPTNPNRAYITSGTSHGHGKNDEDFLIFALPQKSIFQALDEMGITWINYQVNSKEWEFSKNDTYRFVRIAPQDQLK